MSPAASEPALDPSASDRTAAKPRIAVVLMNLGGPDRPEAVRPFLYNLFSDPAILRAPTPVRLPLAYILARSRAKTARVIYEELGGGSPLLPNTLAQAAALETALAGLGAVRCVVAMRYWAPFSTEAARAVQLFAPDRVVVLPLYPQFSTTTTASSLRAWERACRLIGLKVPSVTLCCYPQANGFVTAEVKLIETALAEARALAPGKPPRLLFSAHGLPERIVAAGDPYPELCRRSAERIAARLSPSDGPSAGPPLDWVLAYQSRVGPLAWIGPSTEDEIRRAAADGVPLVIAPIAFVSEHSETLVEIEIEYRQLAAELGVPAFVRVPAVGTSADFIAELASLVRGALGRPDGSIASGCGGRLCPAGAGGCPVPPALARPVLEAA